MRDPNFQPADKVSKLRSADWQDCPYCKFHTERGEIRLMEYCVLHQKVCDLGEDLRLNRRVVEDQHAIIVQQEELIDSIRELLDA